MTSLPIVHTARKYVPVSWIPGFTKYEFVGAVGTLLMAQVGPEETGGFRLLNRRAVLALREFPERSAS